jgi:hypothetical protein
MTITLTRDEAFEIVEMIECMKLGHKYEGIAEIMSDLLRDRLAQPERKWQGLTDEEKQTAYAMFSTMSAIGFVQAIEAKLKEKNT